MSVNLSAIENLIEKTGQRVFFNLLSSVGEVQCEINPKGRYCDNREYYQEQVESLDDEIKFWKKQLRAK